MGPILQEGESLPLPDETRGERKARIKTEIMNEQRAIAAEGEARANELAPAMARKLAGRPSTYDPERAMEICARITLGQSLQSICAKVPNMPCEATVIHWLNGNPSFLKSYLRARELQADSLFDQVLDIADNEGKDIVTLENEQGEKREVLNPVAVARARVRIDARFRMAGKLNPKKYGEKLLQEISGPDGGAIETTVISGDKLDKASRDRLREILATARDITPE